MAKLVAQDHYVSSTIQGSMYDKKDPRYDYFMPSQIMSGVGTLPDPTVERLCTLKEKFKVMEVHSTLSSDVVDMFLVSGLIIPQKLKVSDFDKYKGVSYPRTHLRSYCRKMNLIH